jgi:ferritin-like metal-binding protein YciE
MKWLSEDFENLHALYINQLRVMLDGEEHIVRALPTMKTHANDEQLRDAFQSHLQETEVHIQRLEQILAAQKAANPAVDSTKPSKCKAINTLIGEGEDMITDARDAWVRDAGLIAAAQRIEHYEIATYGTLRQFAQVLGDMLGAELLDKTLQEEGHADKLLSSIAERLNPKARAA